MTASPSHTLKIAVVGGGVIGLSCAWMLARRGAQVSLFERDTPGRGASWVAGGMLAATLESGESVPGLNDLLHDSLALWGGFASDLEQASGVCVSLRREGILRVSRDANALRAQMAALAGRGRLEWIDGAALKRLEPRIAGAAALMAPDDHHVDSRRVVMALAQACVAAGVAVHEYAPVQRIVIEGARARGVVVDDCTMPADAVVVAAGAWSGALGLAPFAHIAPVKGQLVTLQMDPRAPLISHVVWGEGVYLIPRDDGRLIVGGSVEPDAGFDPRLSPAVLADLRASAARILPATEHLPVVEERSGFRPGPADRLPLIGPTGTDGLVGAVGHYRNGILLAPLTAQRVVRAVLG